jgi:transposase
MKPEPQTRAAYSLTEFAKMFGKHRAWAYRMAREGKVKTIDCLGNKLVSAAEVERILSSSHQPSGNP